ncbi:MAG: MFS transporter [Lachnospiraceae bacterium]|nr:MFS transporter [Lachnospiraceae bacterium]
MFNIKKQINRLYLSSVLGQVSLTGAWVAILAARGFSLVEIGVAETAFHIVSLIFEIPSGVLADVFGRKRMLIVSTIMAIISDLVMIFSFNLFTVCLSTGIRALNYNFASGSGDALAYDSMKRVGVEAGYERYASNQMIIYRICSGISTLAAGLAIFLGHRISYGVSLVFGVAQILVLSSLTEIKGKEYDRRLTFGHVMTMVWDCYKESFYFLKNTSKTVLLMFANSLVGALDILLLFFLQAKLPNAGIPGWLLGPALLIMEMGGVLGSKLILGFKKARYRSVFVVAFLVILGGICLEHSGICIVMVIGGFLAALADDALQIRTNAILQDMFPSEQRATLISIEEFTFSVIMIILSPLAGWFFEIW